jgi:hypothetical protein
LTIGGAGDLTSLSGSQTADVAEAGGLTPLYGSQTMCGFSVFSSFSRNNVLSVFFGSSVVTQHTLSFLCISSNEVLP